MAGNRVATPGVALPALARGRPVRRVGRHQLDQALEALETARRRIAEVEQRLVHRRRERIGGEPDDPVAQAGRYRRDLVIYREESPFPARRTP